MSEDLKLTADNIINAAKNISGGITEFLSGQITIKTVWQLLTALVLAAEKIMAGIEKAGEDKHALVREVWDELEEQYKLIDNLDMAIKLPWWAENFDAMVLRRLVDPFISMIVVGINFIHGHNWSWLK